MNCWWSKFENRIEAKVEQKPLLWHASASIFAASVILLVSVGYQTLISQELQSSRERIQSELLLARDSSSLSEQSVREVLEELSAKDSLNLEEQLLMEELKKLVSDRS